MKFLQKKLFAFFSKNLLNGIMKILILVSCLTLFGFSPNSGFTQTIKVEKTKTITVQELFQLIKGETGYEFIFRYDLIQNAPGVNVTKGTFKMSYLLETALAPIDCTYELSEGTIIVKKQVKQKKLDAPIKITGKVTDVNGIPLTGVTIMIKGSSVGTFSDQNGNYSITVPASNDTLEFYYLGFKTFSTVVGRQTTIDVQLFEDAQELDETVIIGYGSSRKRDLTGSISSIKAENISSQPAANPLQAMAGRMAGVNVEQANGLPGSAVNIQIRGRNSLQSGSQPLYIIDGVPFNNDAINKFSLIAANGNISPFSNINPADIDRIDVLKDADATAIYGARGANGVVLITTKRGQTGKAKLDINVYSGFGNVSRFVPMLNTAQYLELRNEAFANDGVTPDEYNAPDLLLYDQKAYTDFQKLMMGGSAPVNNIQGTLSGGNENVKYLASVGYRNEGTVFPEDFASKRISTRMNLDYTSTDKKFFATFSAAFSKDITNLPTIDVSNSYSLPPNYPLYNEDGSFYWDYAQMNPLAQLKQKYKGITNTLIGNAVLTYNPINNLSFKARIGYNETNLDQKAAFPLNSLPPYYLASYAQFGASKTTNYVLEPTVDYSFNRDNWSLKALAGASWQTNDSNGSFIQADNYTSDALLFSMMGAGLLTPIYEDVSSYNFTSLFGRLTYDYGSKYLLNVNYRRDGSSKFGANNRFGNFGSIGGAWVFSKESFIEDNISFLSFGKLRVSYGVTGNDQIQNYLYLPLYTPGNIYDGGASLKVTNFENPDIQWETTRKFEVGLDFGFSKDKLNATFNYYNNRSDNQIVYTQLPTQSGFMRYQNNIDALIENTGFELELSSKNISTDNFSWTSNFNITLPKSKLLSYPGLSETSTQYKIGRPVPYTLLYDYAGVDPQTGAAIYNGDDPFTPDFKEVNIGTPFYGGISNSLSYKNWSMDFLFRFSHAKGATSRLSQYKGDSALGNMINEPTSVLDRWRQPGDQNTRFPGATTTYGTDIYNGYDYYAYSSANYGDISYIQLQSANLSYSLPKAFIDKVKMNAFSIYIQGQNLFSIEKSKYRNAGIMPPLQTFVLGFNCSL